MNSSFDQRYVRDMSQADDHILVQLSKMEQSKHNILIYRSVEEQLALVLTLAKQRLLKNDVVVLLPYYETIDTIEQQLENIGINVEYYKKGSSLFILDAVNQLFGSAYDFAKFLELIDQNIINSGKHGVFVLVNIDAFFLSDSSIDNILEYELKMKSLKLEHTIVVCAYNKERFDKLCSHTREATVAYHQTSFFS